VCDRGYLRHQKRWRDEIADSAGCEVVGVETDVVVPVDVTSDKREFAARTIRPKVTKHRAAFLQTLAPRRVQRPSLELKVSHGHEIDVSRPDAALKALKVDRSVTPSEFLKGGEVAAQKQLQTFLQTHLQHYDESRREPAGHGTSLMSPYLHFGQISPVNIALRAMAAASGSGVDAFLEELIVRRELTMNYVNFEPHYDRYDALPEWARKTLREHASDDRPVTYTLKQLEACDTADVHWNAAMREMTTLGYMHNSMRMYWGKKILEWSKSPEHAFQTAMYLNNKYFLDGRDPNSYANIGWIFGLHDRPWGRRKIFGTIRYMGSGGLDRKFDMAAYATYVDGLNAKLR
jgi:deoxyribodipyrimidine photo-lyase